MMSGKCAAQTDIAPLSVLFLEVPLALFAPAKARGAERGHQFTRQFIISDGLPVGIVRFPQAAGYIRRAPQPVGDPPAVTLDPLHQQGEVRLFADRKSTRLNTLPQPRYLAFQR